MWSKKKKKNAAKPAEYPTIVTELELESEKLLDVSEKTKKNLEDYFVFMANDKNIEDTNAEIQGKAASFKRASANIAKVQIFTSTVGDELKTRYKDLTKSRKRKYISAPANALIDYEESQSNHFAQGLNIYKLLLICYTGSFAGVVVELLWCLITNGYIESRSGLVYGPFNFLYGIGAVAITVGLYRYRNRSSWLSFALGMVVGSVVEYVCSWAQELVFGSRSWDYSAMPFNINGRICLLYSIFWGFLGVLWIKNLYPRLVMLILKIPNRPGKIITWALTAFFAVNIIVTCIAMFRWAQRIDGIAASNAFWQFVDARFPNERMQRIFANMKFN